MSWIRILTMVVAGTLVFAKAEESLTEPPHPARDLKFLVVVDSSFTMLTRREATLGSVEGLVASGFQDQIRKGDKFAVWTFNDQVDSGSFVPREWDPDLASSLAQEAALFAGENGNKSQANLDRLFSDLNILSQLTKKVMVVMFTDGAASFRGTPFDTMFNTTFEKDALKLRASARPFVVAFLMEEGRLTQGMVYSGRGPLRLPTLPGQPPSPKMAAVEEPAPKPQPKVALRPPEPVPTVERMKQTRPTPAATVFNFPPGAILPYEDKPSPGPISTRSLPDMTAGVKTYGATGAKTKPTPQPAPAVAKIAPAAVSTQSTQQTAENPVLSEAEPKATAAASEGPARAEKSASPTSTQVTVANEASTGAPANAPLNGRAQQTSASASPNSTPPAAPESFPVSPAATPISLPQFLWFGVGGATVALLGFAAWLLRGLRRRSGASLISQSLAGKH